jgi:FlaA1/EpsC-like NDP-sugar epimerase
MIRLSGLRVGEDIDIEFVGIRPGEKLFEELHATGETHRATPHRKILVAQRAEFNCSVLQDQMAGLAELGQCDAHTVIERLRQIVPEYQPPQVHFWRVRLDESPENPRLPKPHHDPAPAQRAA